MIYWAWLIVAFVGGILAVAFIGFLVSGPSEPKCPAMLRSGHRCRHDAGHTGPHEVRIYEDGTGQGYAWEDPSAGLHDVGFWPR